MGPFYVLTPKVAVSGMTPVHTRTPPYHPPYPPAAPPGGSCKVVISGRLRARI